MVKSKLWLTALTIGLATCLLGCPPAGPQIGVSDTSLHFAQGEATKTFEVSNTGSASSTLIFTVAADPDWIQVSPNTGTITGNVDTVEIEVTVNADPEYLKQDIDFNEGVITVQDSNGSVEIPVTVAPDYLTENFSASDLDLAFRTVTFTPAPDDTASYYVAADEATVDYPVDPEGGLDLVPFFDEDDPVAMSPFLAKQVWLYGKSYDTFYVGSNGYVSFENTANTSISLEQHFSTPRISGLFSDLDPTLAGSVSAIQTEDAVALTFEDVPEAGTLNSNNFQIVMYFDGTIQLSYKDLDEDEAIVGLSFGAGLPSDFVESDLSAFNTDPLKLNP